MIYVLMRYGMWCPTHVGTSLPEAKAAMKKIATEGARIWSWEITHWEAGVKVHTDKFDYKQAQVPE